MKPCEIKEVEYLLGEISCAVNKDRSVDIIISNSMYGISSIKLYIPTTFPKVIVYTIFALYKDIARR